MPITRVATSPRTASVHLPVLLAASIGTIAMLAGWGLHGTWRALPLERDVLAALLATAVLALAWPMRRWLGWSWASAVGAVWLAALTWFAGPAGIAAAVLLMLAGLALGCLLAPPRVPAEAAIATAGGLLLLAGTTGWLLTFPLHVPWVWLSLLALLVFWQRHAVWARLRALPAAWSTGVATAPRWALLAVMIAGLASTACWLPTMQMDDLTYHLNLPVQLQQDGRYLPDATKQMWSYAPWAGDTLHGIAFVLSRRDAHGAMNALWLLLGAGAAWSLLRGLGAGPRERWAALAILAAFPPLVWMAAGMQTELAATSVLLALTAVAFSDASGRLLTETVLFAGLFALKSLHGLSALPLLVYAAWTSRHAFPWTGMIRAVPLFILVAGSSYAQSWLATGNPILPLANAVFESPYYPPENFHDPRWHAGFGIDLPWRLLFDTDRYAESWDGGLGFALLVLAGMFVWALLHPGRTRALAWVAAVIAIIPLIPMQYARYAYPGMALCLLPPLIGMQARLGRRGFAVLAFIAVMSNLTWQANASWLHRTAALKRLIRSGGDAAHVLPHYVPERLLVQSIGPDSDFLLATDPAHNNSGEMGRWGLSLSAHAPLLAARATQADTDASGQAWARLLRDQKVRWLLVTPAQASPAMQAGIVILDGQRQSALNGVELWQLPRYRLQATP